MGRIVAAALLALAAAAPQTLTYHPAPAPQTVTSAFTYALKITGGQALVSQVYASNPVLTVSEIRATRKGRLSSSAGANNETHVEILFDSSHVDGLVGGKPFQFDF